MFLPTSMLGFVGGPITYLVGAMPEGSVDFKFSMTGADVTLVMMVEKLTLVVVGTLVLVGTVLTVTGVVEGASVGVVISLD